jgi:endonuclease/exonuclease/phosphatase family metal-dependent hydrolase
MPELKWQQLSISLLHKNKTLSKVQELTKIIREIDADIFCLQEVISLISLINLNMYFLENKYSVVLEETNSNRSIYVGFLIKKGFEYDVVSFGQRKMKNGALASRNLSAIVVKENNLPILTLLGVHLKSKRLDEKKINTYSLREFEVQLLSEIHSEMTTQYSCPFIVLGDLNANFNQEPEFHPLHKKQFFDFIKIKHKEKYAQIGTFTTNYLETKQQHLDFILLEKKHHQLIDYQLSDIYLYENEYGDRITLPFNKIERPHLPSDHCPIVLKIKIKT